ncbi:kunitz-type protease inhibitor 2 [Melanotaenia boesemani]|uniref:kunitz-type protease inhibitor 2 n=1 Tax=Melanotaenia boesemani TaxID=1250792 RepID=UPI001C04275C|nr:kunitz-type protease inhibitor 2 [Melanotaenia boesemani]
MLKESLKLLALCSLIRFGLAQGEPGEEAPDGGDGPHIVPLLEAGESRSNQSSLHCLLPMKVGSCRAAFPKFFYNVTNQSCSSFIYGGCEANENNFDSQEECEATCRGVTGSVLPLESTLAPPQPPAKAPRMAPAAPPESDPTDSAPFKKNEISAEEFAERCGAEPQVGPCRAALKHWFYNTKTGSCHSFIYGGCRGNKNNYLDEESCKAACTGVQVLPPSQKASTNEGPAGVTEHCRLRPDPGPCRAAFPKFYYDSISATCQNFVFGGCQGNANQFDTIEECLRSCSGEGKTAFFLFATLAIVSALLLAILVIITFRRHHRSRRPSSSDKEELLPDEQSSLDSLTIPESPKPGLNA